jgi:hypothetical protein
MTILPLFITMAAYLVCQLYNAVIQSNDDWLYGFLVVQLSYTNATCRRPSIWCANCIILSYSPMLTSCIVSCCTIILYQCHMPSAVHMVCQLYNTVCTIILYQCHMQSAVHMLCRLYNTVCTIILYQCDMPSAVHMVCRLYNTHCTIILYQCHMPSAVHMVC